MTAHGFDMEGGSAQELGAHHDGEGVNFALFSAHAEAVELCLFDPSGGREVARLELPEKTHDIWHGYLPGLAQGTCYGYRVHGPHDPAAGHRFNAHKLLVDPYARQLRGEFRWHDAHFGFDPSAGTQDLSFSSLDNADFLPKAVVNDARGSPQRDSIQRRPLTPWHQTVIYEAHVRGFTVCHPGLPVAMRGTFEGMGQQQIIDYLKALGITTVELMPIHYFIDEHFLHTRGLSNYWGYNTLNFFTPHHRYLAGDGDGEEFRRFVDRFHEAGLEVILDVVYNHTCEGSHLGPTVSYRGIDNLSYYQLNPADRRFYINDSGCGNTLNIRHPRVLQLVMDSLRYWAEEMAVDGFRFDLASVFGREEQGFNPQATFFQTIAQDPLLRHCKLIAEPWDLGPGGYQLGRFTAGWSEWNDRYRDCVRRFWRGDRGELPELARRLHGSGDLFEHAGRRPYAGINFITSHDGFTLRDLVSYNHRHNEANLEDNNDGHRSNLSQNHGVEGPCEDGEIDALRWRQQRNFLATLVVSQGVPMILAGDELGRTQQGNNNAYCQDNAINWLDWQGVGARGLELAAFTARLLALRGAFPALQATHYRHDPDTSLDESIHWFNAEGKPMREAHWHEQHNHVLGYMLSESGHPGNGGDRHMLVIFNASPDQQWFRVPCGHDGPWALVVDTAEQAFRQGSLGIDASPVVSLAPRSLQILTSGDLPEIPATPTFAPFFPHRTPASE